MASLIPIFSLFMVILMSLMVVRIATMALVLTGISHQLAQFQARSAFTGAGFTTSESDKVTQHPVRRKIIMMLMLLGNAGIVTAMSSLMLSFINTRDENTVNVWVNFGILGLGLMILWFVSRSQWVDHRLNNLVEWALRRWTDLEVADYQSLLHLGHGFMVIEMVVEETDWLVERDLAGLRLSEEGVLVLGIERPGADYIGIPRGHTRLQAGDTVILYGQRDVLMNLDERRAGSRGNWDHHKAVDKTLQAQREQAELEQGSEKLEK
ncbi:potassium transporter TrkA [Blastopirellula marina]|uniref:Potassium transporter TrkA n=1 Tax=Blastopirellula marina TaxID=124 RepID=A0A2S8FY42_9BACT|nr:MULTISPECIES: TrkA C-terminal domain-containing protein [Pirellulaceae]PQO37099.1 potassium transporter TrkA [Blastopirellula marina]RCS53814.1 potassium transporter TrkA [Bremerella cremea]